jgi:penicillin G amidase
LKIVKTACFALLSLLLLVAMVGYFYFKSTLPVWEGMLADAGVAREVEIERNAHGVPVIRAGSDGDLFFAIGFVHAQDRLFQMDLQRRAAGGRLAEILGTRALARDIWQQYLQADVGIEKSCRALRPEVKSLLESYCRGVNYFLASQPLPPEFHILGYTPAAWQLRDVLAAMKYLEGELASSGNELNHARLGAALLPGFARAWLTAPAPGSENRPALAPGALAVPALARLLDAETEALQLDVPGNAWVVAGSRTASGHPWLANDFSWAPVLPALFYQLAGKAPALDIAGNTLPGVPFILSGRNRQLGWGVCAAPCDTIDYFILERHPQNGNLYRCDGRWLALEFRENRIRCRGRADVVLKLVFSNFGPVIEAGGDLLAVRSLVQHRSLAMEALYHMNAAHNLKEFAAALRKLTAPALRVVFADRKGTIGACQAGLVPLRGKGSGLLPLRVRALSDLWRGYAENSLEKSIANPAKGWIAASDLGQLGKPAPAFFTFDPAPDFQARRLAELLSGSGRLDMAAAVRLQNDTRVPNAEFLVSQIRNLPLASFKAKHVRDALNAWDLDAGDGEGPAFFYAFDRLLAGAIFAPALRDPAAVAGISPRSLYRLLEAGGLRDREGFAAAVEKSLQGAYDLYRERTRRQEDGWHWEILHTVSFRHPLGTIFPLRPLFERGPFSARGGKYCLLDADFSGPFKTTRLAAYKMILDFSDFSGSLLAYPTGQSGHPLSPAYDDQLDTWFAQKYLQMESRGRRRHCLRLLPAADAGPR